MFSNMRTQSFLRMVSSLRYEVYENIDDYCKSVFFFQFFEMEINQDEQKRQIEAENTNSGLNLFVIAQPHCVIHLRLR